MILIYDSSSDQVKDSKDKLICRPITQSINRINSEEDLVSYLAEFHGFNDSRDILIINGMMH